MLDILFIAIMFVFFILCRTLVRLCGRV